ncbi:MAG TPA: Yip1 family protein [Dokdonella sp.]|uniref:Yip1 family protein n=1 Tax=Dokdonella sp. TaxID=2291710 RepID=UPI0025BDFD6E|nr:Yip1 family protein [Dokdonella sp.]MBX3690774.1 YIP1 family protein [Dokdonella sp.]MCW5568618.1 YIP1 family protein [Dokdonella sp.]HNR91538.1 Yip1 family protein [Dokdonella sp.]
MDFAKLIARVQAILLSPKTEWPVIAAEPETVAGLYKKYILILAAIPAVIGFVKGSLIGVSVPFLGTVRTPIGMGITGMIVSYALTVGLVYVLALIINALAPNFGGEKNPIQALKVAAYSYTAGWVASIANIVPWIGWMVALAGSIYGIYLLYLGLTPTMRNPEDKSVVYTVVIVIIGFLLSLVIGAIVGGITAAGTIAGGAASLGSASSNISIDKDSPLGKLAAIGEQVEKQSRKLEAAQRSGDAQAQAEAASQMLGAVLGGGDSVEALAPEALKQFLPERLGDFKRESMSVERSGAMGVQVSTGRARYVDANDTRLDLEITDMGGAKGIMALAGFAGVEQDRQTEYGYEKTYKQGGRLVHEQWDNSSRSGEFGIILGDRFSVKLSGHGEGLDANILKTTLGKLDLAGIEALRDKGVKRG